MIPEPENPLALVGNSVATPLYFDRQIIQAADLNLGEQASSAELARLRAMLHGWGVVAGLVPRLQAGAVTISPGYGVTPSGAELYLPEALDLGDITEALVSSCGVDTDRCALPPAAGEDGEGPRLGPVTGWLTATTDTADAVLRPGTIDGCEHPANNQHPTRSCHQVRIELRCSLPAPHRPQDAGCAELSAPFCADPPVPVELPAPLDAAEDFLVLGRLVHADGQSELDLSDRRALLPHSVVQDWLRSCLCPLLEAKPEPEWVDWGELLLRIRREGLDRPNNPRRPEQVLRMYQGRLGSRPIVELLAQGGIAGPSAFLGARVAVITRLTGMPSPQIKSVVLELRAISELFE